MPIQKPMPIILDGKALSQEILTAVSRRVKEIKQLTGAKPVLRIVTVGNDPASAVYVERKKKACKQCGITCEVSRLDANADGEQLLHAVTSKDTCTDGVILQLPVPPDLSEAAYYVLDELSYPRKDVDGLSYYNRAFWDNKCLGQKPCTALGIIALLKHYNIDLTGKHVAIIGRSDLVGKPLAAMMTAENATVTLCHSYTRNIETYTRMADIVVAAVGKPGFITSDMIKPGAVLIDVGINRLEDGTIVGDCTPDAYSKASAYTPVPGGVGPMTVAMLLHNLTRWIDGE